jgi:hypothetical protein
MRRLLVLATALSLSACSGVGGLGYSYVAPLRPAAVGDGSLIVVPPRPWNHIGRQFWDIRQEEDWTENGELLDGISFITGMREGKAIVRQRKKADQQVPVFSAGMSPQEIAAMLESFYRVRGGAVDFRTTGLSPRTFLGRPGFQFDYEHVGGDELTRRGRAVGTIVDRRLYVILLDAAKMHYFDADLPDFEAIVASAALRGGPRP